MNRRIKWMLLLLHGLVCQTHSDATPSTGDLNKLHEELRKVQLVLDYILTDDAVLSDITESPGTPRTHSFFAADHLKVNTSPGYNVTDTCRNHTDMLIKALIRREQWAIRFIDALGKLESDILDGNTIWLGSYDECINAQAVVYDDTSNKSVYPYRGQYCMASIYLSNSNIVKFISGPTAFTFGICVPETCDNTDTEALLKAALSMLPWNVTANIYPTVQCQERDRAFDDRAIAVTVVASFIAVIICLGTTYDVITRFIGTYDAHSSLGQVSETHPIAKDTHINDGLYENVNDTIHLSETKDTKKECVVKCQIAVRQFKEGTIAHILLAFSMYSNAVKILSTKQATGSLGAVNGIRFLSMSWVILGHTFGYGKQLGSNLGFLIPKMLKRFTFQAIYNGTFSVDSFFVLSGLLLAYLTFRDLEKVGGVKKFGWKMFYFHRFWRLTPPYMLLMMVYVPTVKYWSDGPLWPKDGFEYNYCKDTWWINLLYINNIVEDDKTCMGWGWYLANDMQFFVVSPILMISLYKSPIIGGIVSGIFLVATIITSGVIASVNNIGADLTTHEKNNGIMELYDRPYCRMGPYIIGILTGYILFKTECKVRLGRKQNVVGWLIATGIAMAVLYGLYDPYDNTRSNGVSAFYLSTARTAWGVALAWVIFACAIGYGGFINTLLSWNVYIPLGRLTYCAYLIHPIILSVYYFSRRSTIVFNDLEISYLFVGHLVIAYAAAFVLSLAFESPMMALEKFLLNRDRRS
ncbi:hypothetical protein ACJMK2_038308 [Sinanodonta woodiana]|uniref:Nose resistant-to-fluoxetine protein N-terminal domain-containing protein n=1 Tax=Sinanodonta woodiana TaxID=1069815 RepID=A0ABD3W8K6_SINWO